MARMRPLQTLAVPQLRSGSFLLALALATEVAAQAPAAPVLRDVRGMVSGAKEENEKVRVTLWHNDLLRGSVDAAAEAFAAADGAFTLAGVPWFEKQQWGSHSFIVIARTEKRVGALTVRGDEVDPGSLRIDLGETSEVRGVVLGKETGQPLADVSVWARILGNPSKPGNVWLAAPLPLWTAVTDAEGRFLLKGLPKLAPLYLMAGNLEYARTSIQVDDPTKPVEVVLPLGGKVRGIVSMPDGKPAARVRVRATSSRAGYGETMTADDGTFCLSALEVGVYKVWAEAPDLTVIAVLDLDVAAGAVIEDQKVQLVKGGFIVGRIVDKATGKAITPGPHTDVAMYGPARGNGGSCEATPVLPDGTFRIRAPAGKNHIYLRGTEGWSEPSENVDVVEGQETKVEWQLVKPRAVKK
jgi:hypothetical protein